MLGAASQLQQLLVAEAERDSIRLCSVIRWAGRQPSLQRLLLGNVALPAVAWQAATAAQRGRPGLCIEAGSDEFYMY